jgi:hypothetical protein
LVTVVQDKIVDMVTSGLPLPSAANIGKENQERSASLSRKGARSSIMVSEMKLPSLEKVGGAKKTLASVQQVGNRTVTAGMAGSDTNPPPPKVIPSNALAICATLLCERLRAALDVSSLDVSFCCVVFH